MTTKASISPENYIKKPVILVFPIRICDFLFKSIYLGKELVNLLILDIPHLSYFLKFE